MKIKATESQIQRGILDYLKMRGILSWRNNSLAVPVIDKYNRRHYIRTGMKGASDIVGVFTIMSVGVIMCIEVKSQKGVISLAQKSFLKTIRRRGGIAFVARSIEDVEKELDKYAKNLSSLP